MIWKPVVGYEGYYEVSDQGQVRSLDRFGSDGRRLIGKILSPGKLATGHLQVTLFKDGKGKQYKIHRLVYEAFTRPIPPGLFVLHGGNKVTDNSPSI